MSRQESRLAATIGRPTAPADDDIPFLVRQRREVAGLLLPFNDDEGGGPRGHDATYLTSYRIERFRESVRSIK